MQLSLPPNAYTYHRLQFYGISVTPQWLCDYARSRDPQGTIDRNDVTLMARALTTIIRKTGISTITFEASLFDDTVKIPEDVEARPVDDLIPIIAVCDQYTYKRRPSEKKMKRLIKILGGRQPRWWVDQQDCY
ncbi:hypothetical protein BV25DRAFT_1828804, partial [Artomyces pyxidatus]